MADRFGYGEIGLDIHPCRGCEDYDEPDGCKSNGGCGKPITNADKIRAMSDEELAELMFRVQMYIFKSMCDAIGYTEYDEKKMEHWDDILAWLKQEVE